MLFDVKSSTQRDIYNIVIGLVAPRPIALVSTLDPDGSVNAAPFSSYNYLSLDPPILGLGIQARNGATGELKDTARNIERAGEFVVNVVTEDIFRAMNVCAVDFPPGVSELEMAGLHAEPSSSVAVPRIREAHAALECRLFQTLQPGRGRIILGSVLAIHVEDRYVDPKGPYILAEELHAMGRMNGLGNYVRTRGAFEHLPRLSHAQWAAGERV
jgi:flavin reductase (DIM6/NTAB) family NADH-FMN oxidoreductase RutF